MMATTIKDGNDPQAILGGTTEPALAPDYARARETGRGRHAENPAQIPAEGWKDILLRLLLSVPQNRLMTLSGGVAFFALLSIFPAIATAVSLYGFAADTVTITDHLNLLVGLLPSAILDLIRQQILSVAAKGNGTLGLAFGISLAVALWSANSGTSALFDALNVINGEREKRSLVRLYATTLAVTLGSILFVVFSLFCIVVLPSMARFFGVDSPTETLIPFLRWPVLFLVVMVILSILYRVGPSRREARWRWLTLGSASAALLWIGASMLFSWYVAEFDSYNRLYGSLGAIIAFMTWTWLSIFIMLLGGALDAETEHQTARDSTLGPPKPLGARGANMADHVGRSAAEL
ncbi:YihY/virulence factor BrkB family protein [Labrys monachus]|uniref:Membrane protein n=1 Tax=Labrys monachus TaxID=217067 RepID=A0ABU0FF88_9HYPH|nr:YihY/virulence factor BrkB family protein [Labrys monachus]MDQ0393121.1 membrane protein [Labrys monachus]